MLSVFRNNSFSLEVKKSYFYKPVEFFTSLAIVALAISALAYGCFLAAPYLPNLSLISLSCAKWTGIIAIALCILAILATCVRSFGSKVMARVHAMQDAN